MGKEWKLNYRRQFQRMRRGTRSTACTAAEHALPLDIPINGPPVLKALSLRSTEKHSLRGIPEDKSGKGAEKGL
ncbi:hypothetical protein CEXT_241451 [Caerostris extrusa]|uniref:Uncharacterized protein n=1 Tax=Caerostris extrusa TaxID=172846 RepID=A0AAV4TJN3_CAEEX|nr:hypothetical protein CEXT_241451 [Caerostris extrusa]